MAFFSKRIKGETTPYMLAQKCMEAFFDPCPAVSEALCGTIDNEGKYEVPPMSIALSIENGQLMFRISSSLSEEAFFGSVRDPLHIFTSIEHALTVGEYKAIPNKYRRNDVVMY
jgi:hypothetical protein